MANNLYDFVTTDAQKHQEAIEREGFYTDDTPVGPLEDELKNIKSPLALQYADWIRTKSHGADILESQARWGLLMAKQALDAIEQSGDAKEAAKDLTNRFNRQIGALTEDSEVIDARGNYELLKHRLDDAPISPDSFIGNDLEKINQAIQLALDRQGGVIQLNRAYDITGLGEIILDKMDAKDRRVVIFKDGKIIKNDAGFMFNTSSYEKRNSGDWFFNGVTFESTAGADTTVLNGSHVIRVQFNDCHTRNIDHYVTAFDRYTQTIHVKGGSSIGGKGWLFDAPCYYDTTFSGGYYVEHREHFLNQTAITTGTWKSINGLRFIGAMVEGLSGNVFKLLRVEQASIEDCYFESNKGHYIDLTEADYVDSISVKNNRVYHHPDTNINNIKAFIEWGGKPRAATSQNNFVRGFAVHDTTAMISGYKVLSMNDIAMDSARTNIPNIDERGLIINTDTSQIYQETDSRGIYLKTIPTADLNNLFLSGSYHIRGSDYTNSPITAWGFLEVKTYSSGYVEQTFRSRGSALGYWHYRVREGGVWSAWKEVSMK